MRNYVNELVSKGIPLKQIKNSTGIKIGELRKLISGEAKLNSGTKQYEKVRNLSRRTDYTIARNMGASANEAAKYRRNILRPEILLKKSTRTVKREARTEFGEKVKRKIDTMPNQVFYQLRMISVWMNEDTFKTRIIESFSGTHNEPDVTVNEILDMWDKGQWENLEDEGYGQAHHYEEAQDALDECIISARKKLEGSNWIIIQIIRLEWIKTILAKPDNVKGT